VSNKTAPHIIVLDRTGVVDALNRPPYNAVQIKVQLVDEGARRSLFRKWGLGVADHRLQGLMMAPHRLAAMWCRTAEIKYLYHSQNRMCEVLHRVKDGHSDAVD
jgi:hypothetical protein